MDDPVIPPHFHRTSESTRWRGKIRCDYCASDGWPWDGEREMPDRWWMRRHGEFCANRDKPWQEPTGLADEPYRRYTPGARVAHLIGAGTDFGVHPFATAYCGRYPQWTVPWMGSGSWQEEQEANRLPTCKRCNEIARETGEFVAGLKADLGLD